MPDFQVFERQEITTNLCEFLVKRIRFWDKILCLDTTFWHHEGMRQFYVIPNIITAFGLACGLFVIFKVNVSEPGVGTYELLYKSALILLIAGLADLLDGAVARVIHAESDFGAFFDSLADAITFGVAPSVLVLKALSLESRTPLSFLAILAALFYTISGVLRLVRFNVKTVEIKSNTHAGYLHKKIFTGLPIPAAAACVVSLNLFLNSPLAQEWFGLTLTQDALILACSMIVIGYFMISKWKFPSVKTFHVKVPSLQLVLLCVIVSICLLYGILYFFALSLVIVSFAYFAFGFTLNVVKLILGKKSKKLVDFYPFDDHE